MSDPRTLFAQPLDPHTTPFLAEVGARRRAALDGPVRPASSDSVIDRAIRSLADTPGRPLDPGLARAVMERITEGGEDDASVGALLVGTAPETLGAEAIAAFASVMRERAHRIHPRVRGPLADTCGTGGDGFKTLNVSTATAFVLVAHGIVVAKHGNRGITSSCGSADVLEALGVDIELEPARVQAVIESAGIGFLFAPKFHPAMRHVQPVRRRLAAEASSLGWVLKSVFNVLGPLTNPAGATHQLVGVASPELVGPVAHALALLGVERALVVHGTGPRGEPMDEISPFAVTRAALVGVEQPFTEMILDPAQLGVAAIEPEQVTARSTVEANATAVREVLAGAHPAARELIALNAGAALWLTGESKNLRSAIAEARETLRDGRSLSCLERLVHASAQAAA